MSKLKCWEKDLDKRFEFSYYNIDTHHNVALKKKTGYYKWNLTIEGIEEPFSFKSKAQATTFAQKYMKDHDTCTESILKSIGKESERITRLRKKYRNRKFTPDELVSYD